MNRRGIGVKQQDATDCAAACLVSICAYYGFYCSIAQMRKLSHTNREGTTLLGIIKAAEKVGMTAKGIKANIVALYSMKFPCIAHTIEKRGLLHYIVLYSITPSFVEYMDPMDGKNHRLSIEEFQKKWTGVLVVLECGAKFQQGKVRRSSLSTLLKQLSENRKAVTQLLIGAILCSFFGLATSIYAGRILDTAISAHHTSTLHILSGTMLAIVCVNLLITVWKKRLTFKTSSFFDKTLLLGFYQHLLRLPQEFFDTMRVGEILSRGNDVVSIRAFITDTLISALVNILILGISLVVLFFYSWKLALVILASFPFFATTCYLYNQVSRKHQRNIKEAHAEFDSQMVESITNISTIKQFGLEDKAVSANKRLFDKLLLHSQRVTYLSISTSSWVELVSSIVTVIVLWMGGYLVFAKEISPGDLVTVFSLISIVCTPIYVLISSGGSVQEALIAIDRLYHIMDIKTEKNSFLKTTNINVDGDLLFENVVFQYGVRTAVFHPISFRIKKGEFTAIVGESGSGKSTILSLLIGLYPIQSGSIYIGKHNIRTLSKENIRAAFGIVPQEVELFSGSILFNITLDEEHPNIKRVIEITKEVGLYKCIQSLPQGFNTYISEQGRGLSGGEKQKLSIARVLYKNPNIYLFDEATSSLDIMGERCIQNVIEKLVDEGKTVIMVAHRMRTIRKANHIMVLKKGAIIEEGQFSSLIERKGTFYRLWNGIVDAEDDTSVKQGGVDSSPS